MFPKKKTRKKRKRHRKSIIQSESSNYCFLCMMLNNEYKRAVHIHHVFGGPNRKHSEEYGLTVKLCLEHHTYGTMAVHNNAAVNKELQKIGQQAFENNFEQQEFIEIFGRNYL